MKKLITAAASVLLISATTAQAEGLGDLTGGWSGDASVGATNAAGNSKASSISGAIKLSKNVDKWTHVLSASVLRGESTIVVERRLADGSVEIDPATNAPVRDIIKGENSERYTIGYQPRYQWKDNSYFFGIVDWEKDKPANINTATRQIIGIGHTFWQTSTGFFNGEVGFGNKNLEPVFGDDLNGGIGYVGFNFYNRLTETTTFNADMKSDFGSDNTFTEIGLGLTFKASDKLSVKLSHFLRNNTDLTNPTNPLDADTDTVTTLNLVFALN